MQVPNTLRGGPDERGHFGIYGGRFVAETLMPLVLAVEAAYAAARSDPGFQAELDYYLEHYVGRPSPLYFAERLTRHFGGAKLYLKRDELNHTGAHKINNVLGQTLLARRMGKRRIIAETGAGQHGVATATACALFDLPCVVYMGATDIERQKPNVFRMKLLGAEVIPVHSGTATLKDAMNGVEAGGHGIATGLHAASLTGGMPGVLHGNRTYFLQDEDGQIRDAHSISAGLDYPGIGPEHAWLHDIGRIEYVAITDDEALEAFQLSSRLEGIIPALEPAHALAHVAKIAPTLPRDHLIVMNMCGRGDKDIFAVADHLGVRL